MINILIADDHAVVRRGLKQILSETSDMVVTGEAADGDEVLGKIQSDTPDVVILDITMPGKSGLEVLKDLKRECPQIPVLVLSMHPEEQFARRLLKEGASGYMSKETAPEELVEAVRKVHSGGRYVSARFAEDLAFALKGGTALASHERLSAREYQVLCMIGSGKAVSEIAGDLSLTVKTISTYRERLLDKMGMRNNAELIRYVIDYQLYA